MTAEAKVPNDATSWEAIDIFVFSNGQQYSPPRKYHLNAQELNWWKAILNFLARSQYGSVHSTIDLYTVEGEKLEGPLQLSNGSAYVAVKPPDAFIDTGYSKYLLKATRSWEKSQARKSNSSEITKPDECNVVIAISNTSVCATMLKEEIITGEIINKMVVADNKTLERPQALINVHEYPQRDSSTILQKDKRRVSPIQRSSILRKPPAGTTPLTTKRDFVKSRDEPRNSKGSIKANQKSLPSNGATVTKSKIPQKMAPHIMPAVKQEQVKSGEKQAQIISKPSNTDILISDKTQYDHVRDKDDSLLVSNIFKNTESEIPSVVVPLTSGADVDTADNKKLNNIAEECNPNETIIKYEINENDEKKISLVNTIASSSSEKDLSNQKTLDLPQVQKAPNVSFAEKSDKNYVVLNNGDILNLKLQIEVRHGVGIVNKTDENTQSCTDINKTEKGSQINLDGEMTVQNKSLQSIFIKDFIENVGMHSNTGAVVVKCACCQEKSYEISKINTEASINDSKVYVILLPTPGLEQNLERGQCVSEVINVADTDSPQTITQSSINPVKKTTSTTLEILTSKTDNISKDIPLPIPKRNVGDGLNDESEIKHHVAIIENEVANPTDLIYNNSKSKCISVIDSGIIAKNVATIPICREISASATQTELCSLLLEARRHKDGRYSFHLPPLHILRYYKL